MKQITQQQKRFVSEYIRTLDSESSAKNSGYKSKDLKKFSSDLLKKDNIVIIYQHMLPQLLVYLQKQEKILKKLSSMVYTHIAEEIYLHKVIMEVIYINQKKVNQNFLLCFAYLIIRMENMI